MVKRKIIHNTANFITSARILCSLALLFCTPLSLPFYVLYTTAGSSDIFDGLIARKTNTATKFGAKLDTLADIVFAAVVLIKLLPILELPVWMIVWVGVIALIKLVSILIGFVRHHTLTAVHSVINKITGALVFILPFTIPIINIRYTAGLVCVVATVAAIMESRSIVSDIKQN
ncbi:MAG: CDP-alcohol phosphatidyltransferase family protein [Ruminococcus sp.]|nr:CDP-alcohol phosphatidyltransferase family protein [Ruminococcus sp.]